jgi:formaldehyde-activating enzyme
MYIGEAFIGNGPNAAHINVFNWAIIAGVWVNWEADDADLIYAHNYEAMRLAITRAMGHMPPKEEIKAANSNPGNPFYKPKLK